MPSVSGAFVGMSSRRVGAYREGDACKAKERGIWRTGGHCREVNVSGELVDDEFAGAVTVLRVLTNWVCCARLGYTAPFKPATNLSSRTGKGNSSIYIPIMSMRHKMSVTQ